VFKILKIIVYIKGGDNMLKRIFSTVLISIFTCTSFTLAQLPQNSWSFSFGAKYPRLINHNYTYPDLLSAGGTLGFQRNFSEHVGMRFLLNYNYLHGVYTGSKGGTHAADFAIDLVYYFVPCEPVSPYLVFGGGPVGYILENPPNTTLKNFYVSSQLNTGLGLEWELGGDWNLKTEFVYTTVFDAKFDGSSSSSKGGIFGSSDKSYLSFNLGFNYYIDKGEPSKYCQLYHGIANDLSPVDYQRIEEIVKRHIPREVVKEVVVEKPTNVSDKWVLVGVNFDFNSAKITAESYPILLDAVKTLLKNPNLIVEIQGYTDNIGSEQYNLKLSQRRAEAVRTYLISKGVSANRLRAVGYGESRPVADNKTAEGRAMNRRIEFKIQ